MSSKKAYLIINPRAGQDMTRFPDIITVLAAASWKVDNALVEYGGQEKKLAEDAIEDGYELLIAHGGDGTVNKVVEAALTTQPEGHSDSEKRANQPIVGVISGGTANQWVHEIGYPTDPVQAALALINSEVRHVDVGRISVERVAFPAAQHQKQKTHKKAHEKKARYFLLTAGFGIDAAIISHTSKTLKERIGTLAYDVAATKELPTQHPFHVEIRPMGNTAKKSGPSQSAQPSQVPDGHNSQSGETAEQEQQEQQGQAWQGQALQIVVGNTRRYADVVELTPNAYIDDGLLDICIIVDGGVVKATQQVASLLFKKKPDKNSTVLFRDAHFTITLPAHISLQLDGGAVKLHHLLSTSEQEALERQTDPSQVLITYRIDVLPQAVAVSVPRTYDNTLFSRPQKPSSTNTLQSQESSSLPSKVLTLQPLTQGQLNALTSMSERVTIAGVAPDPTQPRTYVIAGTMRKTSTDDIEPVAFCVNANTHVYASNGEARRVDAVQHLEAENSLLVVGKVNKRGVIQATHIIL